jgi:hypothetical protein
MSSQSLNSSTVFSNGGYKNSAEDRSKVKPFSLYDDPFPKHEQFPRQITFEFLGKGRFVYISSVIAGRKQDYGNPLSDNSDSEDGYRFHDILHIANMAILGWSPVVRAILRLKRKSQPEIDEVQDGARAIFCEEGLVAYLFAHAQHRGFFLHEPLTSQLIRDAILTVSHLEVKQAPISLWEKAILQGTKVWLECKRNNGGSVHADLLKKELSYSPRLLANV